MTAATDPRPFWLAGAPATGDDTLPVTRPYDGTTIADVSLPTRAQIPTVIGQIYAQAQTAGVSVDKGRYAYVPAKAGAIARYEVELPVTAERVYAALRAKETLSGT